MKTLVACAALAVALTAGALAPARAGAPTPAQMASSGAEASRSIQLAQYARRGGSRGGGYAARPNYGRPYYGPRPYYGRPYYGPRPYYGRPGFYAPAPVWAYRPWYRRPYYGTIVGGIVIGTVIAATAYNIAPPRPRPDLCWYWADPDRIRGYWDYCS